MTLFNTFAEPPYLTVERGWIETLRKANLGLFCLLPLLLLFWRGGADAAATLIGVSFLAVVMARRQWSLGKWPPVAIILGIWLILNLVISPLALQPAVSFSRSVAWLRLPLLLLAACLWLIQSRRDLRLILLVWGTTLVFTVIDGLVQLVSGVSLSGQPIWDDRLTGPLDRPNIGMFVARIGFPLLPLAALLLSDRAGHRLAWPAVILAGLVGLAFIFLTGERAASVLTLLSIAAMVGVIILTIPRYRLYGIIATLGSGAILATIVLTSERIFARVLALIEVLRDFGASHYGEIFRAAFVILQGHPITGVGMKNFQGACEAITQTQMRNPCPQHPHNTYLEWLVETGVIGTAGYGLLLVVLIAALLPLLARRSHLQVVGATAAGVMVLLHFPLTASQSNFSNWPALLFWSSLTLTMAVIRLAQRDRMP